MSTLPKARSRAQKKKIPPRERPAERLRKNLRRVELHDASLAEVLLHGLSTGDDAPAINVLDALRIDVEAMIVIAGGGSEFVTFADFLGGVSRRLDVAIVLLERGAS